MLLLLLLLFWALTVSIDHSNQRMSALWRRMVLVNRTAQVPSDFRLLEPTMPLVPRLEKAVAQLFTIIQCNRTVHDQIYNRLITEACSAPSAAESGGTGAQP